MYVNKKRALTRKSVVYALVQYVYTVAERSNEHSRQWWVEHGRGSYGDDVMRGRGLTETGISGQ